MTQKGHGVIRGRRDLLYDPKGHGDLCGLFIYLFILYSGRANIYKYTHNIKLIDVGIIIWHIQ